MSASAAMVGIVVIITMMFFWRRPLCGVLGEATGGWEKSSDMGAVEGVGVGAILGVSGGGCLAECRCKCDGRAEVVDWLSVLEWNGGHGNLVCL